LLSAALALIAAGLIASSARAGEAARPVYTISIGQNAVAEALKPQASGLVTLRYADDDALRFYSLMEGVSRRAFLLSVLDADTQRRFPDFARRAAPPTLAELERVLALVAAGMERDRAAGEEPELVFFFSGHGLQDESGRAVLSLLDAPLTRHWLHEK
jgi:hypothetical protein